MDKDKIVVFGVAHWSARGDIDSDMWEWGLSNGSGVEDELLGRLERGTEEAREFVRDLNEYLPEDYEGRMVAPEGVPGGSWNLELPLRDFKDSDAVYSILKGYFSNHF